MVEVLLLLGGLAILLASSRQIFLMFRASSFRARGNRLIERSAHPIMFFMNLVGIVLFAAIGAAVLGIAVYELLPESGMGSRHLGCDQQPGRAQEICRRLEREMQWTWTGHAVISPGWRITFEGAARTYCAERVGPEDIEALQKLRRTTKDWRAESGADFLIRLVESKNGSGGENITSIFNAANPSFILKEGCPPHDAVRRDH